MINTKSASNSNPSKLKRWLTSFLLQRAAAKERIQAKRKKLELKRLEAGGKAIIEYFHQVDDAHSHLTLQLLAPLVQQYDIELVVHLVTAEQGVNFPEPDLWEQLAIEDAENIAPHYDVNFPLNPDKPSKAHCLLASRVLCNLTHETFIDEAYNISESLWCGRQGDLQHAAEKFGLADTKQLEKRLAKGNQRRKKLQHFGSGNFWFEGEWYWKIDRFYHLEKRLKGLALKRNNNDAFIAPMPKIDNESDDRAKVFTLEYFVSLRSPYSAISWEPTMKFAHQSGINLVVRPVLPMVMRGVPATYEKGKYFWFDAAREAEARDTDFKQFYDPIGAPVLQGYSLYNWANKLGKGNAVLNAFFKTAFVEGVNLSTDAGLKQMVEMAGLSWAEAKLHLNDKTWQPSMEENRNAMYQRGNWGVPCYRLLDPDGKELYFGWGQDRLWLVAKKLKEALK